MGLFYCTIAVSRFHLTNQSNYYLCLTVIFKFQSFQFLTVVSTPILNIYLLIWFINLSRIIE